MTKKEVITLDWDHYKKVTYSPAVKKGNMLFVSGQTGINYITGNVVGRGDLVSQTRQAYENIKEILEKSGSSFADVVKITDYIIPEATAEVRREYLGDDFPASTGVVVNRLVRIEFMIEIDVIAVMD
ncbi:RidA family protein [Chloroflexota bacterium]